MTANAEPDSNIEYLCKRCVYERARTQGTFEHEGKTYQKVGFAIAKLDAQPTPPLEWMWVRVTRPRQGTLANIPLYVGTGYSNGDPVTFWLNEDGVAYANRPDGTRPAVPPPGRCNCQDHD